MTNKIKNTQIINEQHGFSIIEGIIVLALVVVLILIVYSIVNNNSSPKRSVNSTTLLTISRSNPDHQPGVTTFTVELKDSLKVNKLSDDLKSLPLQPQGIVNCPADDGVAYSLKFTQLHLTATVSPTGCQVIKLSTAKKSYRATSQLWADLKSATGQPIDSSAIGKQQYSQ